MSHWGRTSPGGNLLHLQLDGTSGLWRVGAQRSFTLPAQRKRAGKERSPTAALKTEVAERMCIGQWATATLRE